LTDRRSSFQEHAANAYILGGGFKLGQWLARREREMNRIRSGETTVLSLRLVKGTANLTGFAH
jgi:hypothetical protein